jgi:lipid A oxidase
MTSSITAANRSPYAATPHSISAALERLAALGTIFLLCATMASSWIGQDGGTPKSSIADQQSASQSLHAGNETVASGYVGAPYYYRSDLHLNRPNGTDMTLRRLGWDGDAFYFPIDGGARVIRWSGALGVMVDFLHNKAITRLGKGTHGRKIENGVVEDVETTGTLEGKPAPSPLHLTDLLDRLEFTHGHNVLLLTGLARMAPLTLNIRPYLGFGFGAAVPHVEVRFTGESSENWTNEYQYAGPAFQILAVLELRLGRASYFVECKFFWSSISAALTNGKSWSLKDLHSSWLPRWFVEPFSGLSEMPGDLWHQFTRWWNGEAPLEGNFTTHLAAHEIVVGAGYVWPGAVPANAGPTHP